MADKDTKAEPVVVAAPAPKIDHVAELQKQLFEEIALARSAVTHPSDLDALIKKAHQRFHQAVNALSKQ